MSDILQDTISLNSVDADGKHYDLLTRGYFSGSKTASYVIDINTTLFPIEVCRKYKLLLSKSDECIDDYTYVMNGKVFKINDRKTKLQNQTEFYVSFGGLLMKATVSTLLGPITLDDNLYLMIRKVQ